MNLTSTNEHVPQIQRRIRVVKEREKCIRQSLPFSSIPRLLLIHIVFVSIKMLDYLPSKGGVSNVYSPNNILYRKTLRYKRQLDLKISNYCQVHQEGTPRNIQADRKKSSICLEPRGNNPVIFNFMSLYSEKEITRRIWDSILIPDTVIARVTELAKKEPESFYFCIPQRPYYWRFQYHRSGHKQKSITTKKPTNL